MQSEPIDVLKYFMTLPALTWCRKMTVTSFMKVKKTCYVKIEDFPATHDEESPKYGEANLETTVEMTEW